ncbi:MAG TPA: aminoglycoside phosphotransferase family protein [Chloroflexaceae bacterium]|nr:aminoglycoside phosphotransferase family protein [Chloroflexaceae bacterium]
MIAIPLSFVVDVMRREGEVGRRWLDSLPAQVASCCADWGLTIDGAPMHGGLSLVVPVRRGEERAVLKLVWAEADAAHEALALAAWDGHGAVRLLKAEPERRALLVERLDHTRTLGMLPTGQAFAVAGELLDRLAVPAPAGVPRLAHVAAELAAALPVRWERVGRPMNIRLIDAACMLAVELGPGAGELLIHTDLHDANILARERGSHDEAQPLPWLAIDPKSVAGEPAFGVAPLLWRRIDTMAEPAELAGHLDSLCAVAEIDPERVRAWSLVRCLDYWLWGLSIGLTEDPLRCAKVIDWLGWP